MPKNFGRLAVSATVAGAGIALRWLAMRKPSNDGAPEELDEEDIDDESRPGHASRS